MYWVDLGNIMSILEAKIKFWCRLINSFTKTPTSRWFWDHDEIGRIWCITKLKRHSYTYFIYSAPLKSLKCELGYFKRSEFLLPRKTATSRCFSCLVDLLEIDIQKYYLIHWNMTQTCSQQLFLECLHGDIEWKWFRQDICLYDYGYPWQSRFSCKM